jgi:hypothetical protein
VKAVVVGAGSAEDYASAVIKIREDYPRWTVISQHALSFAAGLLPAIEDPKVNAVVLLPGWHESADLLEVVARAEQLYKVLFSYPSMRRIEGDPRDF